MIQTKVKLLNKLANRWDSECFMMHPWDIGGDILNSGI